MDIRAQDLPLLRKEVCDFLKSNGPSVYMEAILRGTQLKPLLHSDRQSAAYLARSEWQRVAGSELFHVTEQMTDLARVAARSFPETGLLPEDLPSPYGFVAFSSPLDWVTLPTPAHLGATVPELQLPIMAASWGLWSPRGVEDRAGTRWEITHGVWVTWYTAPNDHQPWTGIKSPHRLVLDNESVIKFSPEAVKFDVQAGDLSLATLALWSVWTLMNQRIATTDLAHFDRATARRTMRELGSVPAVRIIQLRHKNADSSDTSDDQSREYQHQWVVRGHWRQQWYPAREVHRPIWIAPHVKGPEGAPLIGGERVYTLKR